MCGFAIALQGVAVAHVQQRARLLHRQIDGVAFDDGIEIHVAAEVAGVTGGERRVAEARCDRQAAEHRLYRHFEALQCAARCLRTCNAAHAIQFPANGVAQRRGLGGDAWRLQPSHHAIEAVGVVAVELERGDGDRQRVAGFGAGDKERPDLRVAEQRAGDAFLIDAAGIQRPGLHRIAGPDHQHRCTVRAEGVGVVGRGKAVQSRRGGFSRRHAPCAERMRGARAAVVGVGLIAAALHARVVDAAVEVMDLPITFRCGELQLLAGQGAGNGRAVQRAGDALALDVQCQCLIVGIAPEVGRHDPLIGGKGIEWQSKQQR
ncbi:hypothetical protein D3C81_965220 [compost metagenome]